MPGVLLRNGSTADFRTIARVWRDSWVATGLASPEESAPNYYLERLHGEAWTVRLASNAEGAVLGFLAFERMESWLRQLFVDPAAQRRGIGAALLADARRAMPEGFWLRADQRNIGARRFYERQGMVFEGVQARPSSFAEAAIYRWLPDRVSSASGLAYDDGA